MSRGVGPGPSDAEGTPRLQFRGLIRGIRVIRGSLSGPGVVVSRRREKCTTDGMDRPGWKTEAGRSKKLTTDDTDGTDKRETACNGLKCQIFIFQLLAGRARGKQGQPRMALA